VVIMISCYVSQLTNSVAPEPIGSSLHSPEPATGPYPEPGESAPPPPQACLPKIHLLCPLLKKRGGYNINKNE
jgi:hypothetical protein